MTKYTNKITLVTGNKHKLEEWHRLLPNNIEIESHNIDLDEIQSMDPKAIVTDKAKRAFAQLHTPVIVEDISAGIDRLNGLPGPLIKYFVKGLGNDCLVRLAGQENAPAFVACSIAYYDGISVVAISAEVRGVCVTPRGENGFGFDFGFIPEGSDKTFAEMTAVEKDAVSHRSKAVKEFLPLLQKHLGL